MRSHLKKLKTLVGRMWHDVSRPIGKGTAVPLKPKVTGILHKDDHKLYSLHAPEVECIIKGKSHQLYEFELKVPVTTTYKEGLVIGICSLPGNP